MSEPTLYLFDGMNLLHAGRLTSREELADRLAGWLALRGARGVLVFDGAGADTTIGPLQVRFAADADELIERLAALNREREPVAVVSSDRAVAEATGVLVRHCSAGDFLGELEVAIAPRPPARGATGRVEDALDNETRLRLERLRRGRRP